MKRRFRKTSSEMFLQNVNNIEVTPVAITLDNDGSTEIVGPTLIYLLMVKITTSGMG